MFHEFHVDSDKVTFDHQTLFRPAYINVTTWTDFWERAKTTAESRPFKFENRPSRGFLDRKKAGL
jgi:hypothetical protein